MKYGPFKIIAGDDLILYNNIFEIMNCNNITFTPIMKFNQDYRCITSNDLFWDECKNKNVDSIQKIVKRELQYRCPIPAPGAFIPDSFLKNQEYQVFLKQFKYMEDYPTWYYWIIQRKATISMIYKPYIAYREFSGISSDKPNNSFRKQFINEIEFVNNVCGVKTYMNKYSNPHTYINFIKRRLNNYSRWDDQVFIEQTEKYIDYIRCEANYFLEDKIKKV